MVLDRLLVALPVPPVAPPITGKIIHDVFNFEDGPTIALMLLIIVIYILAILDLAWMMGGGGGIEKHKKPHPLLELYPQWDLETIREMLEKGKITFYCEFKELCENPDNYYRYVIHKNEYDCRPYCVKLGIIKSETDKEKVR